MEHLSQDLAEDLARTLNAHQRHLLLLLMRSITQDAEAEGAGAGIWYIARAIEERILRGISGSEFPEDHQ